MDGSYGAMLGPTDIKLEPVDIKQEMDPDSTTGNSPKKKAGRPKKMKQEKITEHVVVKKKRKVDRFKGMPEEEVAKRLLPDHLAPNLDIVIVGINPGLYAAFVGHHYAGPGNHFWKCLYLSGLIPEPMNAMQDFKLLEYGIGFTNIVARTTRGSADLSRKEIKEGANILTEKLLQYRPKIAVFNGKGIYEIFVGHKKFYFGKQPAPLPGTDTAVYVMPSSSARCSQLPRAVDKVPFYEALKKFRDHLSGKLPDLKDSEITFPDLELKTAVKKEPKEENSEVYPGEMAAGSDQALSSLDQQLSGFTQGTYQVIPHEMSGMGPGSHGSVSMPSHANTSSQELESIPSVSNHQGLVQVKQEPVDSDCHARTNQSETFSLGQFEVYNQSQGSTQNDNHLNNFLNGLYGLVDQVASNDQSQSKYGMVSHTSVVQNGPVQFNDALRDIVREGSEDPDTGADQSQATRVPTSPPVQASTGKTTKASKPRKRKSKTKDELTDLPQSTVSTYHSSDQHLSSPAPQTASSASSSPHLATQSPVQQPNIQHPYTSNMPYTNYTMPTYSNMPYMSQMQMPPMPITCMPNMQIGAQGQGFNAYQSFPMMMPNGYPAPFMGMPPQGGGMPGQSGGMPGYPLPVTNSNYHGMSAMPHQQQAGFDMNVTVKQEKPDV